MKIKLSTYIYKCLTQRGLRRGGGWTSRKPDKYWKKNVGVERDECNEAWKSGGKRQIKGGKSSKSTESVNENYIKIYTNYRNHFFKKKKVYFCGFQSPTFSKNGLVLIL